MPGLMSPCTSLQKKPRYCQEMFSMQTTNRLDEMELLEHAEQEMAGCKIWDHGKHTQSLVQADNTVATSTVLDIALNMFKIATPRGTGGGHNLEEPFARFWCNSQRLVIHWHPNLVVLTELWRNQIIFCAHARCRKKVWRDWVIIDWAGVGQLPAKLWGFVDLGKLPPNTGLT